MKSPSNLQKLVQGQAKKNLALVVFLNQCKMVCSIIFLPTVEHLASKQCPQLLAGKNSLEVYHTSALWKMMVGKLCIYFPFEKVIFQGLCYSWRWYIMNWIPISLHQYHHLSLCTFRAFFSSNGHGYLYTWMYDISWSCWQLSSHFFVVHIMHSYYVLETRKTSENCGLNRLETMGYTWHTCVVFKPKQGKSLKTIFPAEGNKKHLNDKKTGENMERTHENPTLSNCDPIPIYTNCLSILCKQKL